MQVIGIDVGRDRVKAVTAGKRVEFRSQVGEWRERKLSAGGNYEVEINGRKYFVADLAADESYFVREMATESKIHTETQVLFLTALGILAGAGQAVSVVTGLPVVQHTPGEKERLLGLLRGPVEITVNEKRQRLNVDQVGVVPEAGGAYWHAMLNDDGGLANTWLAKQRVRVVDIGSRTVNYCTINQRQYVDRDSGTLGYGIMELHNAEAAPGDASKEQFARRVAADLSKRWLRYDPGTDLVLLTGGGALLLERWLRQHFPVYQLADDALFANAAGYYKMGVARCQRQS